MPDRTRQPRDRGVGDAYAAVAARGTERIGEARAAATVQRDAPVATIEVLENVAVGGERQHPCAEKVSRPPLPCSCDGEQAAWRRRQRRADDDGDAPHQSAV